MADEQETKPDAVETKEEDEGEKKEEATTPSFAKDEEDDGEEKPNPTKEGGEEAVEAAESTATFEPVVKLDEVDVKSGEEEEEILCTYRSKLFLYGETLLDKGTGVKSWKERGIGEARILRHREHQRLRFLMRQEKTMKVIANHALDPRIKLEPNAGSDRSWVWSCYDFADGELVEKVFALRFANSDVACEFKSMYEKYQEEMAAVLAGDDKPDEGGEAADVADALSELKTSGDDE